MCLELTEKIIFLTTFTTLQVASVESVTFQVLLQRPSHSGFWDHRVMVRSKTIGYGEGRAHRARSPKWAASPSSDVPSSALLECIVTAVISPNLY